LEDLEMRQLTRVDVLIETDDTVLVEPSQVVLQIGARLFKTGVLGETPEAAVENLAERLARTQQLPRVGQ